MDVMPTKHGLGLRAFMTAFSFIDDTAHTIPVRTECSLLPLSKTASVVAKQKGED